MGIWGLDTMKAKLEINGNKVEVEGSPAEIRGVLGFDSLCGHAAQEDPGKDASRTDSVEELPKLSAAQKRAYAARRGDRKGGSLMRDKRRIKRILAKIGEVWKAYPDMRLGQLLNNFVWNGARGVFFMEDDETEALLNDSMIDLGLRKGGVLRSGKK